MYIIVLFFNGHMEFPYVMLFIPVCVLQSWKFHQKGVKLPTT